MSRKINIFFACDDKFVKYTYVSIKSLITNANKKRKYDIHVLNTGLSPENVNHLTSLSSKNFNIILDDVSQEMNKISKYFNVRDYYSMTTYYRFSIPEKYKTLSKALYLDSDIIIKDDISKLYDTDIKDNYVGAIPDQFPLIFKEGEKYITTVLGLEQGKYFNCGVLILNIKEIIKNNVIGKIIDIAKEYDFKVTQDQDYLNVACKDHVFFIDSSYNEQIGLRIINDINNIKLLHYNLASKPWHDINVKYGNYFWNVAKDTPFIDIFKQELDSYTEDDIKKDKEHGIKIINLINDELNREDSYLKMVAKKRQNSQRLEVLRRREEYELEGKFDVDLEDDPPGKELMPDQVDYLRKGKIARAKVNFAFKLARKFIDKIIDEKILIIDKVNGIENLQNLESGAIITCNHFNALDSFAIQIVYENASTFNKKSFYRIIKEGNYTSFPGFYGLLMRNCNTLPLSSNHETMKKFMKATKEILEDGNLVLIYPEQAMWWNYRKPRPLKSGGFTLAVNNNVPVLPVFITMEDSNIIDGDGFFTQKYTINIGKPIYPDPNKSRAANVNYLLEENTRVWKETYENFYGIPLTYTTKKDNN